MTGKALDGLYLMIGEEERKIRKDPVGTGSAILKKVFGSLQAGRSSRVAPLQTPFDSSNISADGSELRDHVAADARHASSR